MTIDINHLVRTTIKRDSKGNWNVFLMDRYSEILEIAYPGSWTWADIIVKLHPNNFNKLPIQAHSTDEGENNGNDS